MSWLVYVIRAVEDTHDGDEGTYGCLEGNTNLVGTFDQEPDEVYEGQWPITGRVRYYIAAFALKGHAERYRKYLSHNLEPNTVMDYPAGRDPKQVMTTVPKAE